MTEETTPATETPPAPGWADVIAQADAHDGAQAAPVAPPAMPAAECKEVARDTVDFFCDGVEAVFPMLGYTPDTRDKVARKLAPVLAKYNFNLKYACEIDLAVTVGALVYQSVKSYKAAQLTEGEPEQPDTKRGWFK